LATFTQDNRLIQVFTPLGKDELLLRSFSGQEAVSRPFHFELQMHSENHSIDFNAIVGKGVAIRMILPSGDERFINGVVSSFTQGGTALLSDGEKPAEFSEYRATVVPWLWFLTRTSDCRIFQNMSVPDIIEKVFTDAGFHDFDKRLQGSYDPREYCVQYRETGFNFVSRLMEEEGISYFFEHTKDKHVLVLLDDPAEFKPCPLQPNVTYTSVVGEPGDDQVVTELSMSQEVRPGKYTYKDFNFEQPTLNLSASATGTDDRHLEIYDYPGEYRKKDQGDRLARIRMEEEDTTLKVAAGSGNCMGFVSGYRFELKSHYRGDLNQQYALISVHHSCTQGDNYRSSLARAAEDIHYANHFQCIPHSVHYRPPRTTPVPVIHGSQTAIVVGPSGEEIYVDKYSRVKVQFHWDREGKYDDKSSCFVRVSQNWAGKRWGAMFIPRIGQEVIVDFLDGDPDQPIITGRVYNGESMPPYDLPGEMTKSAIKSYSSKGGDGFNEIRFEDKKGNEQLFTHAEKDMDIRVKNDRREWIGNDRNLIVKRDRKQKIERDHQSSVDRDVIEKIGRDHHVSIDGKQAIKITGSQSLSVTGNVAEEFKANHSEQVTGNYYVKGMQIVIEAMTGLTLNVGGNFITINPAGIQMQGTMVMINSGGSALSGQAGSLVPPSDPADAEIADNADPGSKEPTYQQQREQMSPMQLKAMTAPSHKAGGAGGGGGSGAGGGSDDQKKPHWIEIELKDEAGKPVPGQKYMVTLPDGSTVATGTTDDKGRARVEGIDPGTCKVTFPDLDKDAWKKA